MRSRFEHSRWSCARISHILNSDHSMVSKQSKRILVCGAHLVWSSSVERWECTSLYICREYISITEWCSCSSEHLDKQIELNYNRLENHCDEDNSEMFFRFEKRSVSLILHVLFGDSPIKQEQEVVLKAQLVYSKQVLYFGPFIPKSLEKSGSGVTFNISYLYYLIICNIPYEQWTSLSSPWIHWIVVRVVFYKLLHSLPWLDESAS